MYVKIDLLDQYGRYQSSLNGVAIAGPVRGIEDVQYTARGARLNAAGFLSFSLPLATRRATAIDEGTWIRLWEDGRDQGLYIVGAQSESDDGVRATFTCSDQLEAARWNLIASYAAIPALGVGQAFQGVMNLTVEATTGTYWSGIGYQGASPWQTGTAFTVAADSTVAVLDNLTAQTGYRYRLDALADATIDFGDFRGDSGVVLRRVAGSPNRMRNPLVRPIRTLVPQRDAQSIVTVVAPAVQGGDASLGLVDVWNENGNTIYPGVLDGSWHLTGPIVDEWYDPAFPLVRRPWGTVVGIGAWTYFVVNRAAMAAHRERWASQSFSNITPASGAPSDLRTAGAALYRACVAFLRERADAHTALAITTDAIGDNRGLAGRDVTVIYDRGMNGAIPRDQYRETRTVVDVVRAVNTVTGEATDKWLVDNIGRPLRGDRQVINETWRQLVSLTKNPVATVASRTWAFNGPAPGSGSFTCTLPASPGEFRVKVYVSVSPLKDSDGSTPDLVGLIAGPYYFGYVAASGQEFDVTLTNGSVADKYAATVPATYGQPLGIDEMHDLLIEIPVGKPGIIAVTVRVDYRTVR